MSASSVCPPSSGTTTADNMAHLLLIGLYVESVCHVSFPTLVRISWVFEIDDLPVRAVPVLALVGDRLTAELELAPAPPELAALLLIQVLAREQQEASLEEGGADRRELVVVEAAQVHAGDRRPEDLPFHRPDRHVPHGADATGSGLVLAEHQCRTG